MPKLSRQGGALLLGFVCAFFGAAKSTAAQTSTLPSGLSHTDIGSPVLAGNATSSGSTLTVVGAGTDVGGRSDEFHFVYLPASGDLDVRVQVVTLQNVDPGAKAGLMVRESLTDDARHAFMYVSAGNGLKFQQRTKTGQASSETAGAATSAPVWLRVVRQGNVFSAYSSSTGTTWTQVGSATITMNDNAYVGLAVTSHVASKLATASFANGTLGSSSTPALPSPWTAGDIGSPALVGSATASGGIFTVKGSGQDIWGTSDQFQFAYQQMTGNAEVVARVASLQAADVWTKGGVMIRETLTGPAAHVSMFATGSNGWTFQRRLSAGGTSYTSAGSTGAAPGWVRVVREGSLFSAYQSQDGSQWTLVGSDTASMPATVYVGLAVTSHNPSATATATFSNVAVSTPTSANKPPTVSISAPAGGASYAAPASMAVTASAGDTDGSIAKVDFYASGQLVGSDTSSPFSVPWNNVATGTYNLTAVATDNGGATTTSQPVTVTVGAGSNKPPTVSISAPAAGTKYTAPASISIAATAADPDGSLTRVDFYAGTQLVGTDTSSPFSVSWNNVAAGTYNLTAVATDNAGAKTTSPSITVTVTVPAAIPTTLTFAPPTDYATNVTSLNLELRRSTDALTAAPIASKNLGKPTAAGGTVSMDISTLVDPLPAGSYYGIVISIGPYGSTKSASSGTFTK